MPYKWMILTKYCKWAMSAGWPHKKQALSAQEWASRSYRNLAGGSFLSTPASKTPIHRAKCFLAVRYSSILIAAVFILASFVIYTPAGHAARVTLAWDPNPSEQDVVGYKIYYGKESGNYTNTVKVRSKTQKTVVRLKKGINYYFALTAYNTAGIESGFSGEVMVNTCTYQISPEKKIFSATGGTDTVKVVTQPACEWAAASGASWLTILEGESGNGTGLITYSVAPNPDPEKRIAGSTFSGKTFTVIQKGTGISN